MWVRRKEKEIREKQQNIERDARFSGFWCFVILFLMINIMSKIGFSKASSALNPMSWSEIIDRIPFTASGSFVFSIVLYYFSKRNKIYEMFYTSCFEEKKVRGDKCSCGGDFDYVRKYKYVYLKKYKYFIGNILEDESKVN